MTSPISLVNGSCMAEGTTPQLFFSCKLMALRISVEISVFDCSIKVYYPKWVVNQNVLIRNSKLQVHQGIGLEWLMMSGSCQPLFIRKIRSMMSQEFTLPVPSPLGPFSFLAYSIALPLLAPPSLPRLHTTPSQPCAHTCTRT